MCSRGYVTGIAFQRLRPRGCVPGLITHAKMPSSKHTSTHARKQAREQATQHTRTQASTQARTQGPQQASMQARKQGRSQASSSSGCNNSRLSSSSSPQRVLNKRMVCGPAWAKWNRCERTNRGDWRFFFPEFRVFLQNLKKMTPLNRNAFLFPQMCPNFKKSGKTRSLD